MVYQGKFMLKNQVLVLAAHPDDETLGAGGTLLRHKANGDSIHWLIATQIKDTNSNIFKNRAKEIDEVTKLYKFDSVHHLDLNTMQVDEYSMTHLVTIISQIINKVKPNIIYLPFKADVHSDHRKLFEAAFACTKSFRYPFIKTIYMMEVLSETEFAPSVSENIFIPNVFVDISKFLDRKFEIMQHFKSEIGKHPFPRSVENIRALATLRGATAGCQYAESFMLLKAIHD